MTNKEYFEDRDRRIYEMFISGKSYVRCSIEFEITESGIKQALRRHRKRNNLPKGRAMLTDSAKKLNAQILRNLRQEKEYAIACKNYERQEVLEAAIRQHERMILAEYEDKE